MELPAHFDKHTLALQHLFGKTTGIFLPVIHGTDREGVRLAVQVAHRSGADGVCLIDQGVTVRDLLTWLPKLRQEVPAGWPIGLNCLGSNPGYGAIDGSVDFHWTDHRRRPNITKPWLAGVAFKTEGPVDPRDYPQAVREAFQRGATVAVTSGPGTGRACSKAKAKTLRHLVDVAALTYRRQGFLGVASGVTPENAHTLKPYVNLWLVASGIETRFGVLDPARTADLAGIIHAPQST